MSHCLPMICSSDSILSGANKLTRLSLSSPQSRPEELPFSSGRDPVAMVAWPAGVSTSEIPAGMCELGTAGAQVHPTWGEGHVKPK